MGWLDFILHHEAICLNGRIILLITPFATEFLRWFPAAKRPAITLSSQKKSSEEACGTDNLTYETIALELDCARPAWSLW